MDKASLIERIHSWRRVLSQDIYMMSDGVARIEEISRAVQRFLCKAVISQMLSSRYWILDTGYRIIQHPVSSIQYPVSDTVLSQIREEIGGMDFSGLSFEVLSDIHESYLTRKLIVNSAGELEYLPETRQRKGRGIYYTPRYIVRYIVDRTLGRYLWGTESGRPEGNTPAKTPEDIRDLRILDPACGSGSFLAYAFDVLAEFYTLYNVRNIGSAGASPSHVADWLPVILENHLYGVDLDGDAVDITSAILTLKALEQRAKSEELRAKGKELRAESKERKEQDTLCPMLCALCLNIRQGNFLISDSSAPSSRETGMSEANDNTSLWKRLPSFFSKSLRGFTMILGNPPYGAQFTEAERKVIRSGYETCGSSDSSSLFVEKAVKMLGDDGFLGFIVPKSLSYVVSWRPIREFLLNECRIVEIADAWKAFKGVRLEQMVIIAQKRDKKSVLSFKSSVSSAANSKLKTEDCIVSVLRPERSIVSHSIDGSALSAARFSIWLSSRRIKNIVDRMWENSVPLGHLAEIWSGLNTRYWILDTGCSEEDTRRRTQDRDTSKSLKSLNVERETTLTTSGLESSSEYPVRPCLRGKDIQRYHIRPGIQYIKITDAVKRQRPPLETFCRPKIIAQDIVAHIKKPRPHIKLMATIDMFGNWLNVNTVTNITSSEYHLEYLCGILNSRLISWYAYDFIYNRAVRTMHFRRGYADHIPIRRINQDDHCHKLMYEQLVGYVNEMIVLHEVEQAASLFRQGTTAGNDIAQLDRKIDDLIYRIYGITDEDVRFLREHAGL